jgi:3-deoxy-D-manno-octulosonic-acid transferase
MFSQSSNLKMDIRIILVDKMGLLAPLYSLADVAFIGGSMVNAGGHNPLEPLLFGKPVVFGMFMENFKEIAEEIVLNNAGIMVNNQDKLHSAVSLYLYNEDESRKASINGQRLIEANKGSSLKNMQLILNITNQKI